MKNLEGLEKHTHKHTHTKKKKKHNRSTKAMTLLLSWEHFQVPWSGCMPLIYPKSHPFFFLQTLCDYYGVASFNEYLIQITEE